MKKTLVSLMLQIFVSSFLFAQSSTEARIWSRVESLTRAVFETKDSMVLKTLVSDHLTYGHSGGNLETKAMMVTGASNSATKYLHPEFERISIDVDRKTALVRHIFRAMSVDTKGVETPLNLSIMQVWKKEHGDWKLWGRQAVKIAPKN